MPEEIILEPRVLEITKLSEATRRRMENVGDFPRRRKISPGRVGWLLSDVNNWMNTRQPVSA